MASKYEQAVRTVRHRVLELEAQASKAAVELVRDADDDLGRRFGVTKIVAAYTEAQQLLDLIEAVNAPKRAGAKPPIGVFRPTAEEGSTR